MSEQLSDKAKRFKIEYTEIGVAGRQLYCTTDDFEMAEKLAQLCGAWSDVSDVEIIDRKPPGDTGNE